MDLYLVPQTSIDFPAIFLADRATAVGHKGNIQVQLKDQIETAEISRQQGINQIGEDHFLGVIELEIDPKVEERTIEDKYLGVRCVQPAEVFAD